MSHTGPAHKRNKRPFQVIPLVPPYKFVAAERELEVVLLKAATDPRNALRETPIYAPFSVPICVPTQQTGRSGEEQDRMMAVV